MRKETKHALKNALVCKPENGMETVRGKEFAQVKPPMQDTPADLALGTAAEMEAAGTAVAVGVNSVRSD